MLHVASSSQTEWRRLSPVFIVLSLPNKEKRQKSACNYGTIPAFSEKQHQSTLRIRRKAPFLPLTTVRTAGRSGRIGAEKRQSFLLLRLFLCRTSPAGMPQSGSVRCAGALPPRNPRTLPHVGATPAFPVVPRHIPVRVRKAAQTADTGATAWD